MVTDPAEAALGTDPALEAAGFGDLIGFEQRSPDEAPETDARNERTFG